MKEKIKEKLKTFCKFTKIDKLSLKIKSLFLALKEKIINILKKIYLILRLDKLLNLLKKVCIFLRLDKLLNLFKKICVKLKLDKFIYRLKSKDKELYKKLFILIIVPILIYLYCQFFCNGKLIFEPKRMLLNFMFIYFLITFFYSFAGKLKFGLVVTTLLTGIVGIINHFITAFRGTPLVPWDLFSLNVALTVLPTFKFTVTKKAVLGFILFVITLIILAKTKLQSFANGKVKKLYRVLSCVSIVVFVICFYLTNLIAWFDLNENWDPKEEYHNNGLVASLFKQSRNLIIHEPDGYDVESLTNLAKTIEVPIIKNENKQETPNIIVIMNESFADLSVVGDFKTDTEYLSYFKSLKENTIKGNLHVSIFGATTPNSEWEVLTSNSMAFVPKRTVPYQQYVLRKSYSLASIFKELDYSTTAIHCYYPQGYNRNLAYPRLGFDKFYSMYELKDLTYIREYPDDISTYKNIIDIYENKGDKKMFNFTLTMQNHGSYTDENFANTVIAEDGKYPKLNQYLSLIKIADQSLKELLTYFENQEEHTIIVMFGDHQPYVEDEFYNEMLSQKYEDITSKEAVENKYITPFMIWANYDIKEENYSDITDISTNYLASLILDVANIQKTPYLHFLDELRNEIPIITGNGYMDKTGSFHDFSEENEYTKLIEEYHYLQFNNMFDNSNKLTSLFSIPTEIAK